MPESLRTRFERWYFNFFPAYRGTGARLIYIADDWHEVRIRLPLNRQTKNYVGTIFGGSMYACTDPIYMMMLIRILGPDHIVWDKLSTIRFKRPGRSTLYARFTLSREEIEGIKAELATRQSTDRIYTVNLTDERGRVHATIEKTLYIRVKRGSQSDTNSQNDT